MSHDQPAIPRPLREILADQFRGLAKASGGYTAAVAKDGLHTYVTLAEDTIEQQAKMLRDDLDDLGQLRRLQHQNAHLLANNATLRAMLAEVLDAAARGDLEGLAIARKALEQTT